MSIRTNVMGSLLAVGLGAAALAPASAQPRLIPAPKHIGPVTVSAHRRVDGNCMELRVVTSARVQTAVEITYAYDQDRQDPTWVVGGQYNGVVYAGVGGFDQQTVVGADAGHQVFCNRPYFFSFSVHTTSGDATEEEPGDQPQGKPLRIDGPAYERKLKDEQNRFARELSTALLADATENALFNKLSRLRAQFPSCRIATVKDAVNCGKNAMAAEQAAARKAAQDANTRANAEAIRLNNERLSHVISVTGTGLPACQDLEQRRAKPAPVQPYPPDATPEMKQNIDITNRANAAQRQQAIDALAAQCRASGGNTRPPRQ